MLREKLNDSPWKHLALRQTTTLRKFVCFFCLFFFEKCRNEWSPRSKRRAQMLKVRLFPAVSFPYYPSPVSGQPSSNYCTLMAGPITSRLIVWSLPYVQAAVMLIHLFTQTHKVRRTALGAVWLRKRRHTGRSVSRWARRSNGSKTWKLSQRQIEVLGWDAKTFSNKLERNVRRVNMQLLAPTPGPFRKSVIHEENIFWKSQTLKLTCQILCCRGNYLFCLWSVTSVSPTFQCYARLLRPASTDKTSVVNPLQPLRENAPNLHFYFFFLGGGAIFF